MPCCTTNPTVERLLDDPIMDLLLARDGVTRDEVRTVMEEVRHGLNAREVERAA